MHLANERQGDDPRGLGETTLRASGITGVQRAGEPEGKAETTRTGSALGPSTGDRGIHSRLSCESWRHLASLTDVRPTPPSRILECLPPPFPAAVCNQLKGRARIAGW